MKDKNKIEKESKNEIQDLQKSKTTFTRMSYEQIPPSLRKYKNILNTLEEKTR